MTRRTTLLVCLGPLALALGCAGPEAAPPNDKSAEVATAEPVTGAQAVAKLEAEYAEQHAATERFQDELWDAAGDDPSEEQMEELERAYTAHGVERLKASRVRLARASELLETHRGRDAAVGAAVHILSSTGDWPEIGAQEFQEVRRLAATRLLADHAQSAKLAQAFPLLLSCSSEGTNAGARRLLSESPHRTVRGLACFSLARSMNHVKETLPEEIALLERVVSEFGDIPQARSRSGATLKDAALERLFIIRNLLPGKVAPEIEGEDIDGQRFRLSDYRGQVVLLTFWGHW